ncbi:hypothetical protein H2O64_13075 [Kordia sp. YSTF-M3]|uniref:Uncharacterized protein n=1 Tax=Kordia aestuariivivens TaxID=2759037 RepID=A0ABR7QB35_9FLAO|nr:hypothetical protein [Kordia aestuariivivens]MBC8755603.1 hypothetical protein [Kordia aestuariivivens]
MNNNKIVFKRKVHFMRSIFGIAFFFMGIAWIVTGSLFGMIFCGMSIFFFNKDGSEIDLEIRKYRTFTEVFGFRFGSWDDLPEIEYVSVFSTTEAVAVRVLSAEAIVKNDIIVLNLFYNGNHRIKAYSTADKEDAFKIAKQIAGILKIDILDATEAESKWI